MTEDTVREIVAEIMKDAEGPEADRFRERLAASDEAAEIVAAIRRWS